MQEKKHSVTPLEDPADGINLMGHVCEYCQAQQVKQETPSVCCNSGKIRIQTFLHPPKLFIDLVKSDN